MRRIKAFTPTLNVYSSDVLPSKPYLGLSIYIDILRYGIFCELTSGPRVPTNLPPWETLAVIELFYKAVKDETLVEAP